MSVYMELPKTRQEAVSLDLNRFYSGKPCRKGHIAPRIVSGLNGSRCEVCDKQYKHEYHIGKSKEQRDCDRARYQLKVRQKPWFAQFYAAKFRAKKLGLPFDLTHTWCEENWTGFCALSGLELVKGRSRGPKFNSPSLDRIKPSLGYIQTNCRFIMHALNCAKQQGTDDQLKDLASTFLQYQGVHVRDHLDSMILL